MKKRKVQRSLLAVSVFTLILSTLACAVGSTPVPSSPTAEVPTFTVQPTDTPPPLYLSVSVTSVPLNESNDKPRYTVEAQIPNLIGSTDERVTRFNDEMAELTQEEIARFKDNARMGYATPGSNGSSYTQKATLLSAPGNLISIKLVISTYIEGAAHPGSHARTVNYDLEAGRDVTLDQLFKPDSDYLKAIASYCIAELKTRDIDFQSNSAGADPTPQNYGNWNVTPEGLLITFDEYQVAAYALGPQTVTVPYADLASIIDSNGPLREYIK
jgi:hypothetical protein